MDYQGGEARMSVLREPGGLPPEYGMIHANFLRAFLNFEGLDLILLMFCSFFVCFSFICKFCC